MLGLINQKKITMNKKVEYKDISIAFALDRVAHKKYLIPSLQRKYVWQETQIYSLLDSIMQDYPFGTFLFWNIKKDEDDLTDVFSKDQLSLVITQVMVLVKSIMSKKQWIKK